MGERDFVGFEALLGDDVSFRGENKPYRLRVFGLRR